MEQNTAKWSAGITCEKSLAQFTGSQISTKEWKVTEVPIDLNAEKPVTQTIKCPHCGQEYSVTVTPRQDAKLTGEEVERKLAAGIRKRLIQVIVALVITLLFLPPVLLHDATLGIIMTVISIIGFCMLLYWLVLLARNVKMRSQYRSSGDIPLSIRMLNPYTVALNDPGNVHLWKTYRKQNIRTAMPLKYAELPPMGSLDDAPQFNEGRAQL
jgi:uncharacterized protein (DUF983 family)